MFTGVTRETSVFYADPTAIEQALANDTCGAPLKRDSKTFSADAENIQVKLWWMLLYAQPRCDSGKIRWSCVPRTRIGL